MATVLLVDDSSFSRRRIKARLMKHFEGEIIEGCNGEEAVALYSQHTPDLVLLDLTMPVLDGYGALEQIMARYPQAKIAIVSADIQQGAKDRVAAAGAVAFVTKPTADHELRDLVLAYAK